MIGKTAPPYRGNYQVGWVDVESKQTSPTHPGTLCRIFYPSNDKGSFKKSSSWLPSKWKYAKGYGRFLHVPTVLIALFMYPALGMGKTPSIPKLNLADSADGKGFPVVFFSHGLGGMRTTYSQACGNLASRGFIVVSIEHADGSACYTSRAGGTIEVLHYHPSKDDLLPGEEVQEGLLRVRTKQVNTRRDEVVQTLDLMKDINEGNLASVLALDRSILSVLAQFKGKFDFDSCIMMGHSFGAATSINTLHSTDIDFKCGVLLDPWMYSVSNPTPKVGVPILNVQSHRFHWKENIKSIRKMEQMSGFHSKSVFSLIKDTRHQDASDFGLFFPWLMRKANQSGPLHPTVTHQVQDQLIFDFVDQYTQTNASGSAGVTFDSSTHTLFGEEAYQELLNVIELDELAKAKKK
ncbi:Platelet-activating factor acetylhydrolase [Kappamyces sp. JEL0829]|nr:Platelet-activating factor acetylhydrolase [Kappamyces sp. JEL0829]